MSTGGGEDVALNLARQLHLCFELLATHVSGSPRPDQQERDQETQCRRRTDDRVASQAGEWRGQAVLVEGDLNKQSKKIRPLVRGVTSAARKTTSAREDADEYVTPSERSARHERVLRSKASPQLVGSRRWYLAARGDDGAVALDYRDSRELIGTVVPHVVEEDSERLGVLRTGESSRPLDIAHSLLGHPSCVLKNEIVGDVPVVADRLDEQCDRQNGTGGQECLEPQRRTALSHRHVRP